MAEEKEKANDLIEKIKSYISSIRYGSVNIIIQDGRIVQIDKNEKIRF
jgi:hypothetical protein|uniref:Uncharacterized small protein (DUF2292) n=1 Tax=Eubacterium cellulosolvens (strain ATCC 43171 / JCM 9499 / 6) TaxID=633697 RepID=I5AWQ7_EUBC6